MPYVVTDMTNIRAPRFAGEAETYEAAISMIARPSIVEEDDEYPDHYDILTRDGFIFTIEPKAA